jgi:hypothetical protein
MVMLILPLAGCIEEKINLKVQKKLPSIVEDGRVYWEIRESVDVFVPPGKFIWSGNVTNFSGPLPDRFDFLIEHRAKGGKVLQSWTLEAPLNPDGKIPKMSVDFPGAVLKAKERLRFNMSPRGQSFSGGNATINFLYRF